MKKPQGAFYHFINCTEFLGKTSPAGKKINNDVDICTYLIQNALVALVPGSEFGLPGYFRLCFAKSDEQLAEACKNLGNALRELK